MTELWVLCEHGRLEGHEIHCRAANCLIPQEHEWCPGGHPATVEEVVEWLKEQGHSIFIDCRFHSSAIEADDDEKPVERYWYST